MMPGSMNREVLDLTRDREDFAKRWRGPELARCRPDDVKGGRRAKRPVEISEDDGNRWVDPPHLFYDAYEGSATLTPEVYRCQGAFPLGWRQNSLVVNGFVKTQKMRLRAATRSSMVPS